MSFYTTNNYKSPQLHEQHQPQSAKWTPPPQNQIQQQQQQSWSNNSNSNKNNNSGRFYSGGDRRRARYNTPCDWRAADKSNANNTTTEKPSPWMAHEQEYQRYVDPARQATNAGSSAMTNSSVSPVATSASQEDELRKQVSLLQTQLQEKDDQLFELSATVATIEAESTHKISFSEKQSLQKLRVAQEELTRYKMQLSTTNAALAEQKKRNAELASIQAQSHSNGKTATLKSPDNSRMWKEAEERKKMANAATADAVAFDGGKRTELPEEGIDADGSSRVVNTGAVPPPQITPLTLTNANNTSPVANGMVRSKASPKETTQMATPCKRPLEDTTNTNIVNVTQSNLPSLEDTNTKRLQQTHHHCHLIECLIQQLSGRNDMVNQQPLPPSQLPPSSPALEEDNFKIRSILLHMLTANNDGDGSAMSITFLTQSVIQYLCHRHCLTMSQQNDDEGSVLNLLRFLKTLLTLSQESIRFIQSWYMTSSPSQNDNPDISITAVTQSFMTVISRLIITAQPPRYQQQQESLTILFILGWDAPWTFWRMWCPILQSSFLSGEMLTQLSSGTMTAPTSRDLLSLLQQDQTVVPMKIKTKVLKILQCITTAVSPPPSSTKAQKKVVTIIMDQLRRQQDDKEMSITEKTTTLSAEPYRTFVFEREALGVLTIMCQRQWSIISKYFILQPSSSATATNTGRSSKKKSTQKATVLISSLEQYVTHVFRQDNVTKASEERLRRVAYQCLKTVMGLFTVFLAKIQAYTSKATTTMTNDGEKASGNRRCCYSFLALVREEKDVFCACCHLIVTGFGNGRRRGKFDDDWDGGDWLGLSSSASVAVMTEEEKGLVEQAKLMLEEIGFDEEEEEDEREGKSLEGMDTDGE